MQWPKEACRATENFFQQERFNDITTFFLLIENPTLNFVPVAFVFTMVWKEACRAIGALVNACFSQIAVISLSTTFIFSWF